MLRAVLTDFKAWGGANIITTRDTRLSHTSLPADRIIDITPDRHGHTLGNLADQCTAALVIAPETQGVLARLSALVQEKGCFLLGSHPDSVRATADKWECHRRFVNAGLPTPDTWLVPVDQVLKKAEAIGFPLVMKPLDGVGCEGVRLVTDLQSVRCALSTYHYGDKELLLQQYIPGHAASATLLVSEKEARFVSLNRQTIAQGASFMYKGGRIPFVCDQYQQAADLAKRAAAVIPGLNGYVGVDLMVTRRGCCLMEINPRITTSYIGLRRVVNINLAKTIWDMGTKNILPDRIVLSGTIDFEKDASYEFK